MSIEEDTAVKSKRRPARVRGAPFSSSPFSPAISALFDLKMNVSFPAPIGGFFCGGAAS